MILFKRGEAAEIVVTLTETTTIEAPFYLFRFINQLTKKEISIILEDQATAPERARFNLFVLDVDTVFSGFDDGVFYYKVYQQASSENTDYKLSGSEVEIGIAKLVNETQQDIIEYDSSEKGYITYSGE